MKRHPSLPARVLMTADTVGGVWTYALELARGLGEFGVEIGLATMGARLNASQWSEVGSLPNLKIFESNYRLEWMDSPWDDVALAGEWLLELEHVFQPDLVHLNGFSHGSLPWHSPKIVVSHSCVLSWWRAVKGVDAPEQWNTYREKVTRGLQACDGVVAPSWAMLAALREHYGSLPNATVIPNGRAVPIRANGEKENFIFAAGRLWDEAKNISALAEVAPELSWRVYLAGQTDGRDGQGACCEQVRHLGRLPATQVIQWLRRASIYALPARYEPFGLSILEAALCGCSLVLGDIPSLRENWEGAALFVAPDDRQALALALHRLITNPALRDELANHAVLAAQAFTPLNMAKRYLAVYAEALAQGGRTTGLRCGHVSDTSTEWASRNEHSISEGLTARRGAVSCAS